jgi:hypothetical protein
MIIREVDLDTRDRPGHPRAQTGYLANLNNGERITISPADDLESPLLTITHPAEDGVFILQKSNFPAVPQKLDDADPWMIEGETVRIGPNGHNNVLGGVLLAPSILGSALYGGLEPPDLHASRRFGTIAPAYDRGRERHVISVAMPISGHLDLGRLTVRHEVLD